MNKKAKFIISLLGLTTVGASAYSLNLLSENVMIKKSNMLNTIDREIQAEAYNKVTTEKIGLENELDDSKNLNNYFIEIFNQVNGMNFDQIKSLPKNHGSPLPYSNLHNQMLKLGLPGTENLWFYESYITSANYERKGPNWVMQSISTENFRNRVADRKNSYFNNNTIQVPDKFKAQNKDYVGTGWSKGHMVPAGDNLHSQEAMNQTFLLNTNIVPQDLHNNQNFWYRLESFCKSELVNRYQNVTIISGPVYQPNLVEILTEEQLKNRVRYCRQNEKKFVKYEVIGEGNVAVPNYLFKIVLVEPKDNLDPTNDSKLPATKQPYLIGSFLIPNEPIPHNALLTDYEVPLHEIEVKTGLQFFKRLNFQTDVTPLCEDPKNCEMMTQKQLLPRLIGFARSQRDLNDLLADNKTIDWDDNLNQLVDGKLKELKEIEELRRNNNNNKI
ncbi:hypothetical protein DICPUDRAFT_41176 [Dictyostelium purpureum]|uniref:DNA/RNA non-specific endonuclease n=1 Tax=Dictyostelium purpureum TaxID=5786 RepID=F0ZZH8_DICPU|nr:uncharacterized protein DICPUDRAFT_41176 [Dictyostelium purpureum]EGC30640.1 hypothetical protein DICPUDRAFT_41176 [Dictyostelium purpureum]|eukprot:XP_003292821.1 hypothetical protein DICPUDRAFT_41176 [Dictyostelium purpureum]